MNIWYCGLGWDILSFTKTLKMEIYAHLFHYLLLALQTISYSQQCCIKYSGNICDLTSTSNFSGQKINPFKVVFVHECNKFSYNTVSIQYIYSITHFQVCQERKRKEKRKHPIAVAQILLFSSWIVGHRFLGEKRKYLNLVVFVCWIGGRTLGNKHGWQWPVTPACRLTSTCLQDFFSPLKKWEPSLSLISAVFSFRIHFVIMPYAYIPMFWHCHSSLFGIPHPLNNLCYN